MRWSWIPAFAGMTEKRMSEQDVRFDVTAPSGITLSPLIGNPRHRKKRSEMSALIRCALDSVSTQDARKGHQADKAILQWLSDQIATTTARPIAILCIMG